jgi:SHS2 domain-containing protein
MGVGYRTSPHTADIRLEAWAPSREECVAEAVAGLVASFADVTGCEATGAVEVLVDPGTDEDMLVQVLDEVIYRVDTGEVPVGTEVSPLSSGLRVRFRMTSADRVEPIGAAPKAVSLHELRFTDEDDQWSCTVTVDV